MEVTMKRVIRMSWIGAALALTLGTAAAIAGDGDRDDAGLRNDREARHADHRKRHGPRHGAYPGPYYFPPYPYYAPRLEVAAVPFSPGTMIFVRPDHITVLRPGWD